MSEADGRTTMLLTGARVYTADPYRPWAEAVVIDGDRLLYVGDEATARVAAGSVTQELSLPGALITPGFNDSHLHLSMGAQTLGLLNLDGVTTPQQLHERLQAYARTHEDNEWIEGFGLSYQVFADLSRPERSVLDEVVRDRPVYLRAFDWHTAWANSEALRRAGLMHGAALPLPNEVVLEESSGLATGTLRERAAFLLVERLIEGPSPEREDTLLVEAARYLASCGVTSVQNMEGDPQRLAQYARLEARGALCVRQAHYLNVRAQTPHDDLQAFAALRPHYSGPWNRLRGIKMFIDGVIEGKTALLRAPYSGDSTTGVPDMEPQRYHEFVVLADALGLEVATHAIGDAGVGLALDAYGAARRANGLHANRRHRVEHIELVDPDDLSRFRALQVTASMQPLHAVPADDPRRSPWTQLVGPAREPYAFAWRHLAEAGAPLAFGSDWPVVTPDIRTGLYAAVTRTARDGTPQGGWQPQLTLTLAAAIDAYTRGAAYAEGQEGEKGMLRHGYLADLTVFAHDLFAVAPHDLLQVPIALTIVDGQIVYRDRAVRVG